MKKIYILLLVLVCSVGYTQAQGWYVYDGSQNPADVDGWNTSSDEPGPNMVEDVLNDPQNEGNMVFEYAQPDEFGIADPAKTARKLYRRPFDAGTATSGQVTVVARLKGYGVDSVPTITEIQVHNAPTDYREYLQIDAVDSIVSLERAGVDMKVNANLNEWHIYRFVLDGSTNTATVYLDEDPTPVATGTNTDGTSDHYMRFGDGGSARTAGYTDWIAIDTTGAYAPGEGAAVPDSLVTDVGGGTLPAFGKKVVFITRTDQVGPTGNYPDTLFVVDLKNLGFEVIVPDYSIVADASEDLQNVVAEADIVVIGRAVSSGDFQEDVEKDFWNKLQKPVVIMSNYLVRNNRLDWIASSSTLNYARFGDLPGKVLMPEDPIFDGVTVPPADSIIVFAQDNIGMITMSDSVQNINNGEVLVELINGPEAYEVSSSAEEILDTVQLSDWDGNPLMIRWAPLDTMYDGGATVPYGWRTFITGGDDHDWDNVNMRRNIATYVYSPEMNQAFQNELLHLLTLEQPEIDDDATLSELTVSAGTLEPAFTPEESNYSVMLPVGTTSVTVTATASSTNATVVGGGEFTDIPGTDSVIVTSQAGTVNKYFIIFLLEEDPNADCLGDGPTLGQAVANASAGDTIKLCNDGVYTILQPITIDKKVVIAAIETPTLPGLENMPLIDNQFAINPIFQMADGGELHIIGIDMDGGGAANIINPRPGGLGGTVSMYIDRCRMHNTSNDLINSADASQETVLASFTMKNTFLYNSGAGHGAYIRNFYGTNSPYVFEDITFWDLGQQFLWVSHNTGDGEPQEWMFNHMTGYNLSTDAAENKELFGNSDAAGPIDLTMKNTILSNQVSTNDASLAFYQTSASGDVITLSNLVLHEVQPVLPREGSDPTPVDPLYEADPQFADPDNGDFTVGNTDYYTAADDGGILGARYWHPDYVDPITSVSVIETETMDIKAYPMPFSNEVTFEFTTDKAENVSISIRDISGRTVKVFTNVYASGSQQITLDLGNLDSGMYFYSIQAGEQSASGHLVKAE